MTIREKIWTFLGITEKMHSIKFSNGSVLYCVTWYGKPYQAATPLELVQAVMTGESYDTA